MGKEPTRGLRRSCPQPLPQAPGRGNSESTMPAASLIGRMSVAEIGVYQALDVLVCCEPLEVLGDALSHLAHVIVSSAVSGRSGERAAMPAGATKVDAASWPERRRNGPPLCHHERRRSRRPRDDSDEGRPNAATASAYLPCAMRISPASSASSPDSVLLATPATTLAASSAFPSSSIIMASMRAADRLPGSSPRTLRKSSAARAVAPARSSSAASVSATGTGSPGLSSASRRTCRASSCRPISSRCPAHAQTRAVTSPASELSREGIEPG